MVSSTLLLGVFFSFVSGFTLQRLPTATPFPQSYRKNEAYVFAAQPARTQAPRPKELLGRQTSQQALIAVPDNTCGYFGGSSESPWGCRAGGNCVFATASANATQSVGSVLCCDSVSGCPATPAPTACVDKGRYAYSTACSGSCVDDPMTLKCTSGIALFCNLVTFATPAISNYFCNYISIYDPLPAETSYSGQTGRSFTPTIAKFAASTTSTPSTSSALTSSGSRKSTRSSSATATSASNSESRGKSHKGAIIGGVIGGIAGLALIIAAVLLFLRRRRRARVAQGVDEKGGSVPPKASK